MDSLLKKFSGVTTAETKTGDSKTGDGKTGDGENPSQTEILANAKVLAEAARATFQHDEKAKIDNAELAGATGDLLDDAQKYGKLDESSGVGSYVEKAENYLHKYETSHSTRGPTKTPEESESKTTTPPPAEHPAEEAKKPEGGEEPAAKPTTGETEPASEPEKEKSEGGIGGYAKMAQGFFSK